MRRTSLSIAAGLTAVLLVSATPAQAAVSAKDLPRKGDIVKTFPELADAEFTTFTTKQVTLPGATCGTTRTEKVKGLASIRGMAATGQPFVQSSVTQATSAAKVKAYFKAYKGLTKKCGSYTDPTSGATITTTLAKAPKLGRASLVLKQETALAGATSYSTSVFISNGKRMAAVVALDDAAIPGSSINKLAKVAAKKMK
jgi:hypothetical protein